MKRSVKKIIVNGISQSKYLFKIRSNFTNWFDFILNRLMIVKSTDTFRFRNGLKVSLDRKHDDGWSPTILMDIFIKEEYGEIKNDSVIIDIGANIGAFSLMCAYKYNCICYAYEPDAVNYDIFLKNVQQNDLTQKIFPFKAAVSDIDEKLKLYKTISMSHSLNYESEEFEIVDSVSLGKIMEVNKLTNVDYLKIDCEGGEYDIIYNSDPKIFKKIKNLLLEYHFTDNDKKNGTELIKYIKLLGFTIKEHKVLTDLLGIIIAERK